MRKNTRKGSRGAVVSALAVLALMAGLILLVFLPVLGEAGGEISVYLAMGLYAAIILAAMAGLAAALGQRLRELKDGEEDEAKKY